MNFDKKNIFNFENNIDVLSSNLVTSTYKEINEKNLSVCINEDKRGYEIYPYPSTVTSSNHDEYRVNDMIYEYGGTVNVEFDNLHRYPLLVSEMFNNKDGSSSPTSLIDKRYEYTPGYNICNNKQVVEKRCHKSRNSFQLPGTKSVPPVIKTKRRLAANAREQRRMIGLNAAFNQLRMLIPMGVEHRLSKVETLRMAKDYIAQLIELVENNNT